MTDEWRKKWKQSSLLAALVIFWGLALGIGLARGGRYDASAGAPATAPAQWPVGLALPHDACGVTLVMVVHPQCPCSHASLEELNHLLAHTSDRITADIVVVQYAGMSDGWVRSANWRQASALPGVHVLMDAGGRIARRLGARTSGQTYVYSPTGRLLFCGGLTGARGHEGDNAGLTAAVASLQSGRPDQSCTSVFGCPLFTDTVQKN